jgi:hypothetical protein
MWSVWSAMKSNAIEAAMRVIKRGCGELLIEE